MANNFTLNLLSVANRINSIGDWYAFTSPSTYSNVSATIIGCLKRTNSATEVDPIEVCCPPSGTTSGTASLAIDFNLDTTAIVLTGAISGTFGINSLPAGFSVATATFSIFTSANGGVTNIRRNGQSFQSFGADAGSNKAINVPINSGLSFLDTYGVQILGPGGFSPSVDGKIAPLTTPAPVTLTGTYNILSGFSNLAITPNTNLTPGTKVTITNTTLNMTGVSAVLLQYAGKTITIPFQDFLYQDPLTIVIWWPQLGNYTNGQIVAVYLLGITPTLAPLDPGVQFYGSVLAGTVTINFVDGSGIYVLVPGQAYDTVYNSARDGTTTNVNILDPIVEIGPLP